MRSPGVPANERERLAELDHYQGIDLDDAPLRAIARVVSRALDVPIVLVSLIGPAWQRFSACHGLQIDETGRDVSFCGHVVWTGEPLVVPDTQLDERFHDNPFVVGEPNIRFYAGFPLRTERGFDLGTLCAIDRRPRELTEGEAALMRDLAGVVMSWLEHHRQHHEVEVARREAIEGARKLEALFDAMAEGVVLQEGAGVVSSANAAAASILGLTADELTGRTSADPRWRAVREDGTELPHEEHPASIALHTGRSSRNVVMGVHKPSGELTWISMNAEPIRDESGNPRAAVATFHDISTLRNVQLARDRLAQQERLVTAGTLAAGVGHEINNPLTFVLANVELALEEVRALGGGSPSSRLKSLTAMLEDARSGAERIKAIVRGLRILAREDDGGDGSNVANAVASSVSIADHELRPRATVLLRLDETPPVATSDSRLSQVIVNLLVNAAQSFVDSDPSKNRIRVTSRVASDGFVEIEIADNGRGIAADDVVHIFDPFFTTKRVGEGTGLGLAICHSIVSAAGGTIAVASRLGEGTTFTVRLPVAKPPEPENDLDSVPPPSRRPGRVLVVDDELLLTNAIARVLEPEHVVVACNDPRDAMRRLTSGEHFDIVFCDLSMPHLRGDDLFDIVRHARPDIASRFVFMSGGALDHKAQRFLDTCTNPRVDKPLDLHELRAIVRRAIDSPLGLRR